MAISSAAAITVSIICALCAVIIAAAVHRVVTHRNKGYDDNGAPQTDSWMPNNYPAEQMQRLAEVRWRSKKMLWEVARDYRLAQGMSILDWYPGDHWSYEHEEQASGAASGVNPSTAVLHNPETFEQIPLGSPANIGYAYRSVAYPVEGSPEPDEDDFGVPVNPVPRTTNSPGLPFMLKRWTQHGAPRRSQQQFHMVDGGIPRIMLNDNDIPLTEYDSYAEAHVSPYPRFSQRSSSVYSRDNLNQMPIEPPVAYVSSTPMQEFDFDLPTSPSLDQSRVHQMIAQWERTNGVV